MLTQRKLPFFFLLVLPFLSIGLVPQNLALMVIVPIIYFFNKQKSLSELHPLGKSKVSILAFMVFLFLVTYFCPLVIITFLYGKTAHTIWFRRTPGERLTETQQSQDEISKKKLIRVLVLIVTRIRSLLATSSHKELALCSTDIGCLN